MTAKHYTQTMARQQTDVLISGGGIAGLAAAIGFAHAGYSVICVDPAVPVTDQADPKSDLRTTAFLQPAQRFLDKIGIWSRIAAHAMPLQTMRIIDAGGTSATAAKPPVTKEFNADELGDLPFGWNLPNWLLRREFLAAIDDLPMVEFRAGCGTANLTTRQNAALVRLTDGATIEAKLLVAADGRNSPMRDAADISVKTSNYGQKAVVCSVLHDRPHGNVSTEIHQSGGPFTLVPLPDVDGRACSSLVWMETNTRADALMKLDVSAFEAAMTERSVGILGPLKLIGRRGIWPIISQYATKLTAQRMAIIAEAAHVVPPIGAQGLNMSLGDLEALLRLAKSHKLGGPKMLAAFQSERFGVIRTRVQGIDALNRASMAPHQAQRDLRALGLTLLHGVAPLRRSLMRLGLGAKD